jgi:hypothetical protein
LYRWVERDANGAIKKIDRDGVPAKVAVLS